MEIFTLLETIENLLENSKRLPFSNKNVVDKDEILNVVREIKKENILLKNQKIELFL